MTRANNSKGILNVPLEWNTYNQTSYPIAEAETLNKNVTLHFRSLKVDRLTSARLQGGFTECLRQRWFQSN